MTSLATWIGFVLFTFLAALPGAWCPPGAWYAGLRKPWFNPPAWVFGPVWTLLYVLIATSAWLVFSRHGADRGRIALSCWCVQLFLNLAWTPLFFCLQRMDLAFIEIVLLALAIAATIREMLLIEPAAGWLLVPYLLWVSFAALLNFSLWRLNA